MSNPSNKTAVRTAIISGLCACWLFYEIATASETPGTGLMILQYGLLALSLIGLIGSVVMLASRKAEG